MAGALAAWKGGAIVVSHDRELLRQMDRIVELSGHGAKVYGGNYDLYVERKAQEEAAATRDLENAERRLAQADAALVRANLAERGFHLQLPPQPLAPVKIARIDGRDD